MSESVRAVEFHAEIDSLKTATRGESLVVVLVLPEYCIPQSKILLSWLHEDIRFRVSTADFRAEITQVKTDTRDATVQVVITVYDDFIEVGARLLDWMKLALPVLAENDNDS